MTNHDDAINEAFYLMENIKNQGLDNPVSLETYAYQAGRADKRLHEKLRANAPLTEDIIAKIDFARRELHMAEARLSACRA
ncbi:MAG: hypothetical protein LBL21_01625 [Rickettsiales bacterium]|nr:hypothetical protein [Rickettsiales bacterium]